MCGRYVITKPIFKTSNIVKTTIKIKNDDNFNAHPQQNLPVIKSYSNGKTLEVCKWGLIPGWSKKLEKFTPLINARQETLFEKLTFKNLIQSFRCVVPADGYFEWKRENNKKIPFYLTREDKKAMFFAAIHQNNQFCIITREANDKIKEIHHRQPLIIGQNHISPYLNINKEASKILNSIKAPNLKYHEVDIEVNKPTNNYPKLINSLKKI